MNRFLTHSTKWAIGLAALAAVIAVTWVAHHSSWRLTALAGAHLVLLFAIVRILETRRQTAQAVNQKLDELRSRLNH